jgi:hypothetical protein
LTRSMKSSLRFCLSLFFSVVLQLWHIWKNTWW